MCIKKKLRQSCNFAVKLRIRIFSVKRSLKFVQLQSGCYCSNTGCEFIPLCFRKRAILL